MRPFNEILKDGRISVMSSMDEDGAIRIVANLHDPVTRKAWYVIFTSSLGWEHMSISSPSKTPSWDTMCLAKSVFWGDDECCVEYHPRAEDYVNNHEHCLHIWKPIGVELPTPPSIMVGIKGVSQAEADAASKLILGSMSTEQLMDIAGARGIKVGRGMRRKAG